MNTIDAASFAAQFAQFEVQNQQSTLIDREDRIDDRITGLSSLKNALGDFENTFNDFTESNHTFTNNKSTLSDSSYFSVEADSSAITGTYPIFVKQLASKHSIASSFDQPDNEANSVSLDTNLPRFGIINLQLKDQNGNPAVDADNEALTSISINLATDFEEDATLADLIDHINSHSDNPGINASVVQAEGKINLLLGSRQSGADFVLTKQFVEDSDDIAPDQNNWLETVFNNTADIEISTAQNAIIYLGDDQSGIEIENSSNTFNHLIEGVDIELNKVMEAGTSPIEMDISLDRTNTKKNLSKVVNAYNTLMDNLDFLTRPGSEQQDAGSLSNDGAVKSIRRQIDNLFRASYGSNATTLFSMGIEIDRNGKASIDQDRFDATIENDPGSFDAVLKEENSFIDQVISLVSPLTGTTGTTQSKIDSANTQVANIQDRLEALDIRYQREYDRYLQEFTTMNALIDQMNQTQNLFYF